MENQIRGLASTAFRRAAANDPRAPLDTSTVQENERSLHCEKHFKKRFGFHACAHQRAQLLLIKTEKDLTDQEIILLHTAGALHLPKQGDASIQYCYKTLLGKGLGLTASFLGLAVYTFILPFISTENPTDILFVLSLVSLFGALYAGWYNQTFRVVGLLKSLDIKVGQKWSVRQHVEEHIRQSQHVYALFSATH